MSRDKPVSPLKLKLQYFVSVYFFPNKHQIVSGDETWYLQQQSAAFHSLTLVC